jgi:hypothetical protein
MIIILETYFLTTERFWTATDEWGKYYIIIKCFQKFFYNVGNILNKFISSEYCWDQKTGLYHLPRSQSHCTKISEALQPMMKSS